WKRDRGHADRTDREARPPHPEGHRRRWIPAVPADPAASAEPAEVRCLPPLAHRPGPSDGRVRGVLRDRGIRTEATVIRRDVDPICLIDVYRRIRRQAVDLVHTHLIHADLYGGLAARLAGVRPIVSTRHNDDSFRRRSGMRILTRWSSRSSARVVTPSHYLADFTRRMEGVAHEKIRTIPYAVGNTAPVGGDGIRHEIGIEPAAPLVVTVGRLIEQKGHRYLLQAWPRVTAARPDARLL